MRGISVSLDVKLHTVIFQGAFINYVIGWRQGSVKIWVHTQADRMVLYWKFHKSQTLKMDISSYAVFKEFRMPFIESLS